MDPAQLVGSLIWLVMLGLGGFALYRLKTRRSHIGSAAAGTVYDIIHEEKRKAIEIVVADKAAAHDFEHADDNDKEQKETRRSGGQE
jgi:hypothetical protein